MKLFSQNRLQWLHRSAGSYGVRKQNLLLSCNRPKYEYLTTPLVTPSMADQNNAFKLDCVRVG